MGGYTQADMPTYSGSFSGCFSLRQPDTHVVEFHARQGFILWLWLLLAMVSLLVPIFGILFFRGSVSFILMFSLFGLISVFLGRFWQMPVIGRLAARML